MFVTTFLDSNDSKVSCPQTSLLEKPHARFMRSKTLRRFLKSIYICIGTGVMSQMENDNVYPWKMTKVLLVPILCFQFSTLYDMHHFAEVSALLMFNIMKDSFKIENNLLKE